MVNLSIAGGTCASCMLCTRMLRIMLYCTVSCLCTTSCGHVEVLFRVLASRQVGVFGCTGNSQIQASQSWTTLEACIPLQVMDNGTSAPRLRVFKTSNFSRSSTSHLSDKRRRVARCFQSSRCCGAWCPSRAAPSICCLAALWSEPTATVS